MKGLKDIKKLSNKRESFGSDGKSILITLCPCPPCLMRYSFDKELLIERLPENHELRALIISSKMSSRIYHDPTTIRQREIATDNGIIVCTVCETEISLVGDEADLFVLHAQTNPTCQLLQLSRGYTFIHKVLQELKMSIRRKDSCMQMESCIALINVYADNMERDHLRPETARKIVAAEIDYFFLHDGRFGNASDIAEILEQY